MGGSSTSEKRPRGVERIADAFAAARAGGRAALMPYYTLGYPDPETSLAVICALAHGGGADLIELGVPFSDPLADGPTIQRSTQAALQHGMTVRRCLQLTRRIREAGVTQPLLLMGYLNPILAYGMASFVADAVAAGADGFIIPDLPPEEGLSLEAACQAAGCALVYLLAPTADTLRAAEIARRSTGFLYLVSVAGVTGARDDVPAGLEEFVRRVRPLAHLPLAVGFGIATPRHAALVGRMADGVIVGSALINAVDQAADPPAAAGDFLRSLRAALEAERQSTGPLNGLAPATPAA
jgi:tryptophan synthase alpha chain